MPGDFREIDRRLEEEYLLHRHGFEPVAADGGEIWISAFEGVPELWTRGQALACIEEVGRAAR